MRKGDYWGRFVWMRTKKAKMRGWWEEIKVAQAVLNLTERHGEPR